MPGARGRGWLKIKHTRTLDLVIVAAEWGYGRRHGWLSNYHLAARQEWRVRDARQESRVSATNNFAR